MKAKELIKLNNEKQKQLTEENAKDYEDMLTYIRLSSSKSEQQTEEILLELLDHALLAQAEGKTIRDVFGDDLKAYSQDVIEEIPEETKKKQIKFSLRLLLIFATVTSLFSGIVNSAIYYIFGFGDSTQVYHLGSSIAIMIINILIVFGVIYFVLEWIKSSTFKEKSKKKSSWVEFLQLWLVMTLVTGLFFCVVYFMPSFGMTFTLPTVIFIPIGIGTYLISILLKD